MDVSDVNYSDLPDYFDYRNQSVVSNVKDQLTSPICYIFAAVGALESSYMLLQRRNGTLKSGEVIHFSEMDTVNCIVNLTIKPKSEIYNSGGWEDSVLHLYANRKGIRIGGLKLDKYTPPFTDDWKKVKKFKSV